MAQEDAMFEDGQLYSPVTEHEDGTVEVHLAAMRGPVSDILARDTAYRTLVAQGRVHRSQVRASLPAT